MSGDTSYPVTGVHKCTHQLTTRRMNTLHLSQDTRSLLPAPLLLLTRHKLRRALLAVRHHSLERHHQLLLGGEGEGGRGGQGEVDTGRRTTGTLSRTHAAALPSLPAARGATSSGCGVECQSGREVEEELSDGAGRVLQRRKEESSGVQKTRAEE